MSLAHNRMSSSSRPLAAIALGGLALALSGCGEAQKQAAPPPPKVTVAKPVKRTIVDRDEYVGRFVAVYAVEVRARVSGYLDKVQFQDGQIVKQGDLAVRRRQTVPEHPRSGTGESRAGEVQCRFCSIRSGAWPAAATGPDHQRADIRAALAGGPQCPGGGDGERGAGAAGRARCRIHRAQGSHHRPHR